MQVGGRRVLVCSCDGSMPVDGKALAAALGTEPPERVHHQLCRAQLDSCRAALGGAEPLLIACGQEAPLFQELAREMGAPEPLCVDIRDRAGWSHQAEAAVPKMAALLAEAVLPVAPTASISLVSEGRVLVIGRDQAALDAACRLGAERPATCLLLPDCGSDLMPPPVRALGIFRGKPLSGAGHLGAFRVGVAELAGASPSGRGALGFAASVGPRELTADVVLDLSGGALALSARDGWLAPDPRDPVAVERAMGEVLGLVGDFEKPRWIRIEADLCAHARNGQVACTRCVDVCPTGAMTAKGDSAQVDAHLCDGHGACAAVCPSGAIRFDVPAGNGLFARLSALLETYLHAGGTRPVLLLHGDGEGAALLSALARFGDGLPASVLPLAVPSVAALGVDFLLTALTKGVSWVVVLADPRRQDSLAPLRAAAGLVNRVAAGLGWQAEVTVAEESDPDALSRLLAAPVPDAVTPAAEFLVLGGKRQTLALALAHLHRNAPRPVESLALEAGDPFGAIVVDQQACTLCLACISACPARALSGHSDKPSLGLLEANCIQCGLCRVTCPEKAVTLVPRLVFGAAAKTRRVLKEEDPYGCIRCGKPFATRSVVERMVERMSGHSMFQGNGRLDLIRMCEDCRVVAQGEMGRRDKTGKEGV